MRRAERRLFKINDRLAELDRDLTLMQEELSYHRHLNDDAQRDALVSDHPEDRAEARQTRADVARFEREIKRLADERAQLEAKRAQLLGKLTG